MASPRRLVTPAFWISCIIGKTLAANRSASWIETARPLAAAVAPLVGLPSFVPQALREARADLVRSEIIRRSFGQQPSGRPALRVHAAKLYEADKENKEGDERAYFYGLLASGSGFAEGNAFVAKLKSALKSERAAAIDREAAVWLEQNGDFVRKSAYAK
jgi:hypothetical protein